MPEQFEKWPKWPIKEQLKRGINTVIFILNVQPIFKNKLS